MPLLIWDIPLPANEDAGSCGDSIPKVVAGLVELGQQVVVFCHSHNGGPATDALAGLGRKHRTLNLVGGVTQIVYIATIVLIKGKSDVESFGAFGNDAPRENGGSWMDAKKFGR